MVSILIPVMSVWRKLVITIRDVSGIIIHRIMTNGTRSLHWNVSDTKQVDELVLGFIQGSTNSQRGR